MCYNNKNNNNITDALRNINETCKEGLNSGVTKYFILFQLARIIAGEIPYAQRYIVNRKKRAFNYTKIPHKMTDICGIKSFVTSKIFILAIWGVRFRPFSR